MEIEEIDKPFLKDSIIDPSKIMYSSFGCGGRPSKDRIEVNDKSNVFIVGRDPINERFSSISPLMSSFPVFRNSRSLSLSQFSFDLVFIYLKNIKRAK